MPNAAGSSAILTLNAGSSSIKFALFRQGGKGTGEAAQILGGMVEELGAVPRLIAKDGKGEVLARRSFEDGSVTDHGSALASILRLLEEEYPDISVAAVGHRVVHGGVDLAEPAVADETVLQALEALIPLAPLHQPYNIDGIRAAAACFPDALQVACFDTAFHRNRPWVNDTFGLPRSYYEEGIRRYGFHGISYEFIAGEMRRIAPETAAGTMVVAHLGNGASLCAIQGGRAVASSMGLTALDGLAMGTRCGQIDPGVLLHLMTEKGMDAAALSDLLYNQSGLLGLSGESSDMRALEASDRPEAREAIDYFVSRIRGGICTMAGLAQGLDGIVFCGGIGENSARVRAEVISGLAWLGIDLDEERNRQSKTRITTDASRIPVYVVPTDEERMIARHAAGILAPR